MSLIVRYRIRQMKFVNEMDILKDNSQMTSRKFFHNFGSLTNLFTCNLSVGTILDDKMNLTVRLGKQFLESSPCLPRQLGTGQQVRYTSGTLIKQFP